MSPERLPPEDPDQPQLPGEEMPEDLGATVKRGVSLAAGGYVLGQVLNLGFYIVLARLIAPQEFGTFAAATALYGFAMLVNEGGLMAAVIHRRDRLEEAMSTAAASTLVGGILLSLGALAISPLIGLFFDDSEVTTVAAASAGMILLRTLSVVPAAILQRRFSFLRRLVIEPAQVVVFGVTAVVCASEGLGVWALVIGQYASSTADVVLSWAVIRWRPRIRQMSYSMWRELVAYGRHVLAATFILRLGEQSDAVIVGRLLGSGGLGPLGQFRYAFRLAGTPFSALLSGASYVIFPAFARIADDKERFNSAYLRSLRWMCVFAFPAGLILIPFGEPLAVLVFGDIWQDAGYAAMGMCLLTAGGSISSIASEALKAIGRPQPLTAMHTVTTLTGIAAMIALVPLGLTAVAAGLSVGAMLGAAYALRVVDRVIGIGWQQNLREIWPPALAALIMAAVMLPVELLLVDAESHSALVGLPLLAGEVLVATAIYVSVLAAISRPIRQTLVSLLASGFARVARLFGRSSKSSSDKTFPDSTP